MEPRQAAAAIATYLGSGDMDVPDHLRAAADAYARACAAVNERLAACDDLLRADQRSEALRQAQLEPDLLRQYAALELPDPARWTEIALQVGLAVPPQLGAATARRLHAGFTAEQAVGSTLRQYRLLNLSRAPLRRRLDVARVLARAEPTNLGWAEDVRAHEAARFDEIRDTLADHPDDWAVVSGLADELAGNWTVPTPLDLVGAVQQAHDRLRRERGERVLDGLNPRLLAAVDAGDDAAVEDLADRVRRAAEEYGVRGGRLLGPVRRAEEWLEAERRRAKREKQFDAAVGELRAALADGVDWWYVRECYRHVREFREFEVPDDVAEDYASRARVRAVVRWGAAGVAALAAAAGLYAGVFRS